MFRFITPAALAFAFLLGTSVAQAAPELDLWTFWQPSNEASEITVDHAARQNDPR